MRDLIGNRIEEGTLLYWIKMGLVCKVARMDEGKRSLVGADGKDRPAQPSLTIEITFPVDPTKVPRGEEVQLTDFIRTVSPVGQELMDQAMGGSVQ